jgi:dTDP-4-dehydrorhamnose 3,5-epimerase
MLSVICTEIPEVKLLTPRAFEDPRGLFSETYHRDRFIANGVALDFIQDNESVSKRTGTVRGLHLQCPPQAQAKLVRVTRGRIFDVAVDIRASSPTYGKWVAHELSSQNRQQLLIPEGFAHGFCTLEPDTQVLYKVTAYYSPEHEFGIAWDDPDLAIAWPVTASEVSMSEKDRSLPAFTSFKSCFE